MEQYIKDAMKKTAIGALVFSLPFWVVAIGLWTGGVSVTVRNNNEQFISKENVVMEKYGITNDVLEILEKALGERKIVEKAELEDGWVCDKPKMTTDLLQPSGYWIGDTISCWKLETPIEEWCKENPNYCQNL